MSLESKETEAVKDYEPPTVEIGSPMDFNLPEIYPGVRGYSVLCGNEVWIPLVVGDGDGKVGEFLDRLSARCVLVNVCSPRLASMLNRRGWKRQWHDGEQGRVDVWRKL